MGRGPPGELARDLSNQYGSGIMSGIAGIIRFDGAPVEAHLLESMTTAMSYRGPDGINHWLRGSVALGQCMLRTTPESLEETQPLTNEDESLVLVMDGRVDNWEELREELLGRGARLRTRADAELVLRSYEAWGTDCLAHIDGDFAFVIWDAGTNEAFCARDPMGNKPFTYHWDGSTFTFASDLHPVLEMPWVPQEPNLGMIAEIVADKWYSLDETLWSGVMRLPAAHFMWAGSRGAQTVRYWEPDLGATLPYTSDEEYIEHYRTLFDDTVRRMSRSHRPVAFEVSGGLDSSAVFCVAEHLRREGKLPAPAIAGYTLNYEGYPDADDLPYARSVGEFLGVTVKELPPSFVPVAWFREKARLFRDFPGYPNFAWNLNIQSSAASAGGRVIVTGVYGDQFIVGSRAHYEEELALLNFKEVCRCFRNDVSEIGLLRTIDTFIRKGLLPLTPNPIERILRRSWRVLRNRVDREPGWLMPSLQARLRSRKWEFEQRRRLPISRRGQLGLLYNLYYGFDHRGREILERFGAFAGLEVRHPFNSRRLVEFAFQTPERLRSRGEAGKFIHRKAMEGRMPRAVLERGGKADFTLPIADFLIPLENLVFEISREKFPAYINGAGIKELLEMLKRDPVTGGRVWPVMGVIGCGMAISPEAA